MGCYDVTCAISNKGIEISRKATKQERAANIQAGKNKFKERKS